MTTEIQKGDILKNKYLKKATVLMVDQGSVFAVTDDGYHFALQRQASDHWSWEKVPEIFELGKTYTIKKSYTNARYTVVGFHTIDSGVQRAVLWNQGNRQYSWEGIDNRSQYEEVEV